MFQTFFSALDLSSPRLEQTIARGNDPGEVTPESLAAQLQAQSSSLPSALKSAIDRLLGKGKPDRDDDEQHI